MFLEADPVVFIDIVLYVDPQRVEDALKTREKKKARWYSPIPAQEK